MSESLVVVNGKKTNTVSVFDHGFLYSDGIFDTLRIFNEKLFFAPEHIERFFNSAAEVGIKIPYSKQELLTRIEEGYKEYRKKDVFVRIILTRGEGEQGLLTPTKPTLVLIFTERAFKPLQKVKAMISPIPKFGKDSFGRSIKGLNYGLAAEVLYKAKQIGISEVIFTNEKGLVSEASTSNIFIVKDGQLYTPSLESGVLPGITREVAVRHFNVTQKELTVDDLLSADEVFLTGTTNFVTSVETIGDKVYEDFSFADKVFHTLESLM